MQKLPVDLSSHLNKTTEHGEADFDISLKPIGYLKESSDVVEGDFYEPIENRFAIVRPDTGKALRGADQRDARGCAGMRGDARGCAGMRGDARGCAGSNSTSSGGIEDVLTMVARYARANTALRSDGCQPCFQRFCAVLTLGRSSEPSRTLISLNPSTRPTCTHMLLKYRWGVVK